MDATDDRDGRRRVHRQPPGRAARRRAGERVRVVERPGADVGAPAGGGRGRPGRHPRPRGASPGAAGRPAGLPPGGQPEPLGPRPRRVRRGEPPGDGPRARRRARRRGRAGPAHQHREHPDLAPRSTGRSPRTSRSRSSDAVGPYCRSKLRAENEAMARPGRAGRSSSPTRRCRSGPGDRGLSPPTRLIRDFCRGKLPARMDCTLNLIDVRDVAEGLIRTMERGRPGRRYLLGGENLTLVGLLGILSELTGVPVPRWRVPYPARAGRRARQRVLGRPRHRPAPQGDRHRRPPDPPDDALRPVAEPRRAGPLAPPGPRFPGGCRGVVTPNRTGPRGGRALTTRGADSADRVKSRLPRQVPTGVAASPLGERAGVDAVLLALHL